MKLWPLLVLHATSVPIRNVCTENSMLQNADAYVLMTAGVEHDARSVDRSAQVERFSTRKLARVGMLSQSATTHARLVANMVISTRNRANVSAIRVSRAFSATSARMPNAIIMVNTTAKPANANASSHGREKTAKNVQRSV